MRIPRRATAAVVTLAVAGACWAGYAAAADDPSYRTAVASIGDVEETVALAGTVEPAGRADLAFATSGTVARLAVRAGQKVRAGAVLGTLGSDTLRKEVQHARAAVAAARAQLEADIDAQTSAVTDPTDGGSSPQAPTAPQAPAGPSDQPSQPPSQQPTQPPSEQPSQQPSEQPSEDPVDPEQLAELAAQQQAVLTAQSAVSASLAVAATALAAQQAACVDVSSQACADALVAVQAAQQQVSTDQQALQTALEALGATLAAALGDASADPASASTPASGSAIVLVAEVGPTVTAATLARDQASIDQAEADLVAAEQELAMATVTAPFAGRVVAVDAEVGDSVAAGTDVFVLVSQGTTTVQVAASSTEVGELEPGQGATATPAGADEPLTGEVTQVSSIPDDEGSYPVTITLDRKHLDLPTGLTATVAVVTGTATDVVTVPVSAVSDGTVTLLDDGAATRTPVTTGIVGRTEVEITDGVAAGDEVALADLTRPLPTGDGPQGDFPGGPGGPPVVIQRDVPKPQ
ncbi:HlyD family efflux transporter periplasmic adaptor subunit [Nocardioides sp. CGMCC 1.13656]|uniref:efflux RND transporter periplasmic adaptor subunit n=1 Tax=Nocardioides TaxID=1839 RepID=UPI0012FB8A96|nr:HlyD family efflux transporter periplasmic adaptor subunit [Nocardioides sp. CGMCC 1.13656]MBA2952228.1 HlyD family efflux transporter periplasmic adaptor subunit [Nocardioides sp. CGMCC 1.13656]